METIAKDIAGSILNRIGNATMDYTINGYKFITTYKKKSKELKDALQTLKERRNELLLEVEKKGVENGEKITADAEAWVKKVNKLIKDDEIKNIIRTINDELINQEKDKCFCGFCHGNLRHRYKCGKTAYEKLTKIRELQNEVPKNDRLTRIVSGEEVEQIILDLRTYGWRSRMYKKEELVDLLLDPQVTTVGFYGPLGSGKTEVLKDLRRDEHVMNTFSKIVRVTVTNNPNIKDIQDKIAKTIEVVDWKDEDIKNRAKNLESQIRLKREKLLIILDVSEKLDLNSLGTGNNDLCKHLVVSRSANICRLMNLKENVVEMKPMSLEEAQSCFWKRVYDLKEKGGRGDQVTTYAYISLAKKLIDDYFKDSANAIMSLANVLGNVDITKWKELEAELKGKQNAHEIIMRKSVQASVDSKVYEAIGKFSALACVFPLESSVPVLDLMRYAIGLDLIKDVNNLSQAMSLAEEWVLHLISSYSLDEDEDENKWTGGLGHVIVPRFTRHNIISDREKQGKDKYMLQDISRWTLLDENVREESYTTISLASNHSHSCISEQKFNHLETLILNNSKPKGVFSDKFFQGMTALKVLVLKGMDFQQKFPTSIGTLTNLTTLHLEDCKLLGDISWIGNLKKLIVLSLRGSSVDEIPENEMKKLQRLRVLDLTKCKINDDGMIPANVLSKLPLLEGFYAYDISSQKDWADCSVNDTPSSSRKSGLSQLLMPEISSTASDYASIDELNSLNQLNVLEIKIRNPNQLPNSDNFVKNLNHFYIFVGKDAEPPVVKSAKGFSRVFRFGSIEEGSQSKYKFLSTLLLNTQCLSLEEMKGQPHFIQDIKQLEKSTKIISLPGYHRGEADFQSLQFLEIHGCHDLEGFAAIPIKAPHLNELRVIKCSKMNYVFKDRGPDLQDEFPFLSTIYLSKLDKLGSLSSTETTTSDLPLHYPALFNKKMTFPSLNKLTVKKCNQIVNLWDTSFSDKIYLGTWKNLTEVCINSSTKLRSLGSLSMAVSLKALIKLEIYDCPLMKEVFCSEPGDLYTYEIFPKLQKVSLDRCPKLKRFISSTNLVFPSLEEIKIQDCPKMNTFSSGLMSALKLRSLTVEPCKHSPTEIQDVNTFIKERNAPYPIFDLEVSNVEAQKNFGKKSKPIFFKSTCTRR